MFQLNYNIILLALLVGASLLLGGVGWAEVATNTPAPLGSSELKLLELILTGNFGLAIGLGAAIVGIYQFSQQNTGFGITLVIAGVLIALAPGLLNGTRMFVCPITQALGYNISC